MFCLSLFVLMWWYRRECTGRGWIWFIFNSSSIAYMYNIDLYLPFHSTLIFLYCRRFTLFTYLDQCKSNQQIKDTAGPNFKHQFFTSTEIRWVSHANMLSLLSFTEIRTWLSRKPTYCRQKEGKWTQWKHKKGIHSQAAYMVLSNCQGVVLLYN